VLRNDRKKSNSRMKPSVKFRLLTPTWNQVLRLATLNPILRRRRRIRRRRRRRRKKKDDDDKPQQKSKHRL